MIINPQFISLKKHTAKRRLHRIDLHERGGEHCIEIKEREEAIQLISMDPKVCGRLLTPHLRAYGVDVEALRD